MADSSAKSDKAFRTIGELADELGVPQHILRYWETKFPQLRPLQRAGNRRYYRADDVALAWRIHRLLNEDGYTIRGVQQLLARKDKGGSAADAIAQAAPAAIPTAILNAGDGTDSRQAFPVEKLRSIRSALAAALEV